MIHTDGTGLAALRAVVTGGGSGIGLATTRHLAANGARVAVLDIDPQAATVIGANAPLAVKADVTDSDSVEAAITKVVRDFGGLDILVNSAGVGAQGTIEDNPDSEWRRVYDVNVLGIVRTARAALPHLRRSTCASIVNVCSIVAGVGLPQRALYSATKGAVYALTLAMAADHLADGIRVNCVSPGTVDTPWVERLTADTPDPDAMRTALRARQPLGRLVTPDEVAAAILYLAGPTTSATTGTDLRVDGGLLGLRISPPTPSNADGDGVTVMRSTELGP